MQNFQLLAAVSVFLMSGCAGYNANPASTYANYNCNQLAMERSSLNDEMEQATGKQSTNQIFQLAMTAFALSNGDSYNAKTDTAKTDHLKVKLDEVHHEEIRKQCNW